jgi:hypothetical protein
MVCIRFRHSAFGKDSKDDGQSKSADYERCSIHNHDLLPKDLAK